VYASCADELNWVKQRLAETPKSGPNEEPVESAKVKIQEAEEALQRKDEQGCMSVVKAADATLPD
jgi:hypothetical protein